MPKAIVELDDDDDDDTPPARPKRRRGREDYGSVAPSSNRLAFWLAICIPCALVFVVALALVAARSRAAREREEVAAGRPDVWDGNGVRVTPAAALLTDDGTLYIFVSVATDDPRKRVQFDGWRGAVVAARDDAGNVYRQKTFDLFADALIERQWNAIPKSKTMKYGAGVVTSDQSRVVAIAFTKPPPAIAHLDFELNGKAIGARETIKIRADSNLWKE